MRPELWHQAEELFHAALEQPPEDRQAFLDKACGQDTELRRHVDLLVSAEENAGSFLDKARVPDLTATISAAGSLVGQQFGHYRIVSPLGVGGMGEVYRAHDTKLSRRTKHYSGQPSIWRTNSDSSRIISIDNVFTPA